ncbi:hypothetical protein Halha_0013 [Halobacteroides halobius DSM 5150]|uniref:Uncharacterized protein n=1 Tax=Halobacteroides halobius (strain ATCC 35273 / DSM 5150 / MD-1) TaxID=748449 RepID=L0K4V3_HALHC|nr:CLC_0170 family protein [Halobacteroides halobius]AGB40051.1 hypothetical protein Halha_0013 [Halobacteroides halobius DSM 5150]
MLELIITTFNFIYSLYFVILMLITGGLILTLDLYYHQQQKQSKGFLISRTIGLSYIILGGGFFLFNKIIISLDI